MSAAAQPRGATVVSLRTSRGDSLSQCSAGSALAARPALVCASPAYTLQQILCSAGARRESAASSPSQHHYTSSASGIYPVHKRGWLAINLSRRIRDVQPQGLARLQPRPSALPVRGGAARFSPLWRSRGARGSAGGLTPQPPDARLCDANGRVRAHPRRRRAGRADPCRGVCGRTLLHHCDRSGGAARARRQHQPAVDCGPEWGGAVRTAQERRARVPRRRRRTASSSCPRDGRATVRGRRHATITRPSRPDPGPGPTSGA